jgi:quinol monooxygenase YgiN
MVRYKTKAAQADANEALVRAVFAELKSRAPGGLHYTTYRMDDGVSFVHIATREAGEKNPLATLPAFKAFQKELEARCVEPPVFSELTTVGAYASGGAQ